MAVGLPLKTTYANGDVFAASDINDTNGTINANTAAVVAGKNKLINGNFAINQRAYVSAATLASGVYGFDRWKSSAAGTTLTFTASTQGQTLTINSGGSIEQVIEQGILPAATYTLSWTGTATARVYNTGATPPSYAASPITIALDGTANVEVEFTASGGTRTCGSVQLEQGSSATAFALAAGTLQGELAACQRYYFRNSGASTNNAILGFSGVSANTTLPIWIFQPPVTMRIAPTSVDFANLQAIDQVAGYALSSVVVNGNTQPNVIYISASATGLTAFRPLAINASTSNAFLGLSAEL